MRRNRRFEGGGEWDLADVNEQELAKDTDGAPFPTRLEKQGRDCAKGESLPSVIKKDALPPVGKCVGEAKERGESEEEEKERSAKKAERRKSGAPYAFVTLLCFLCCVALAAVALGRSGAEQTEQLAGNTVEAQPSDSAERDERPLGAQSVYERRARSAVTVVSEKQGGTEYWTGTAVLEQGYVATLCDAVTDARGLRVICADGAEHSAVVVGVQEETNLALLYCEAQTEPICVGDAGTVSDGSEVFAIGSIGGGGHTQSLLAARADSAEQTAIDGEEGLERIWSVIRLGSLAESALRGCPVFDGAGKAVGILVFCQGGEESMAIPFDRALAVLSALREGRDIEREDIAAIVYTPARLGIFGEDGEGGVRVADFFEGDTDAKRKLRAGDVIYKVGEAEISDTKRLAEALAGRQSGEQIEVFVRRSAQKLSFWVTLV